MAHFVVKLQDGLFLYPRHSTDRYTEANLMFSPTGRSTVFTNTPHDRDVQRFAAQRNAKLEEVDFSSIEDRGLSYYGAPPEVERKAKRDLRRAHWFDRYR